MIFAKEISQRIKNMDGLPMNSATESFIEESIRMTDVGVSEFAKTKKELFMQGTTKIVSKMEALFPLI